MLSTILAFIYIFPSYSQAQTMQPTPRAAEVQEQVRVFTEEVIIPLFADEDSGRSAFPLDPRDIMVFEDDVPQQVRSIHRVPASVLLLLDTSGEMNPAMSVRTTREVAMRVVSNLTSGDRVAALQFGGRMGLLQDWTTEKDAVTHALKTKLFSGKRARLVEALMAAASKLKETPIGNRHIVLITDGVESSGARAQLTEAVKQLLDAHVTVYVISYGMLGRKIIDRQNPMVKVTNTKRRNAKDIADEIMNPTQPSDAQRKDKIYVVIDTDVAMRRKRGDYEEAAKESEKWLAALAENTGGLMASPQSPDEMIRQGEEVARQIGSQYVVTYTPKRPLASAAEGEYRALRVVSLRLGTQVRTRRGYVATPR